jgi:hypothetical protein
MDKPKPSPFSVTKNPVRPEPGEGSRTNQVRPDQKNPVRPEPVEGPAKNPARPEPVEGPKPPKQNQAPNPSKSNPPLSA